MNFKWFKFSEMTDSATAKAKGIDNEPKDDLVIANIYYTLKCLDNIREAFGQPIIISSGYRSFELNREIRGAKNSQHVQGEAADFTTRGPKSNKDLYNFIKRNYLFDQLINEKPDSKGNPSWIHCSFVNNIAENRKQCLIFKNGRYIKDYTK